MEHIQIWNIKNRSEVLVLLLMNHGTSGSYSTLLFAYAGSALNNMQIYVII